MINKTIFIKKKIRKNTEFQFYMHQFIESAIKFGIPGIFKRKIMPYKVMSLFRFPVRLYKRIHKPRKSIIITSNGYTLFEECFQFYDYEIVPMLWDVWPGCWNKLYKDLQILQCKILFVTVKSFAEKIQKELNIKTYWIPEGIDINDYNKGSNLSNRQFDIYELGRQHKKYHTILVDFCNKNKATLIGNKYSETGKLLELAFPSASDLLHNINKFKIIICFPQTDTHPDKAGNIETLTQRYWEAMLSRCLIIGRAPQELIELIGYNPVIDVDWSNPELQLKQILSDIEEYQEIVDKNYTASLKYASWDNRIEFIKKTLKQEGYNLN